MKRPESEMLRMPNGPRRASRSFRRVGRGSSSSGGGSRRGSIAMNGSLPARAAFPGEESGPPDETHDKGDHENHQEEEEQDPGDLGRAARDPAETQNRCDEGDGEEDHGPSQHGIPPS